MPRHTRTAVAAAIAVVPLTLGAASAATFSPTAGSAAATSMVHLVGTRPAAVLTATRLAALPADKAVEVALVLRRPDEAGEKAAFAAVYSPASPDYHHFLTPAQYADRFGVAAGGLSVAFESANRDYLLLKGTARAADSLFHVDLGTYRNARGTFQAPDVDPVVPAALPVAGVLSLDSLHVSKVNTAHGAPAAHTAPAVAPAVAPAQTSCNAGVCNGLTTPQDLWSVYDQPNDNFGAGQRMAIFGEGEVDVTIKSLRAFEASRKLRHVNVRVRSVSDDFTSTDGTGEWQLDTQASTGMAPDAAEEALYFGDNLSDASTLAVAQAWQGDADAPLQASASYGECEASPGSDSTGVYPVTSDQAGVTFEAKYEDTMRAAATEGRTLFASTGDTGSGCAETSAPVNGVGQEPVPFAPYPAGSAYVVAVGGTVLFTDTSSDADTDPSSIPTTMGDGAKRSPDETSGETGWVYGGGGSSKFIPLPDGPLNYQAGVVTPQPTCVSSADGSMGNSGKPCKSTPDIAAQSGDLGTMNGYGIASGGNDVSQGAGTSLSSPLALGMWTRINAAAPAVNGGYPGLGFADYSFYKHQADFHDITAGGSLYTPATPGYDMSSGLGTMDVAKLARDLAGQTRPANPVFPAPTIDPLQVVCSPAAVITDPAGDATSVAGLADAPADPAGASNDPGLDILGARITQDATVANLTFHVTMADLAGANPPGQLVRWEFGYDGAQYYVRQQRDASGTTSFSLVRQGSLGATSPTVLSKLVGAFNDQTNEITTVVPVAAFNTAGALNPPLGPGRSLTDLALLAQRPTGAATLTADSADSGGCPLLLTGATSGAGGTGAGGTSAATTGTTGKGGVYRATTLRVGGRGPVRPTQKRVYTLRLFVDPGAGSAPSNVGRPLGFYVDGRLRARLRTGRDGTIRYALKFPRGRHVVSAVFYGTPDLRKSTSPGQKVRSQ